jgi:hypothetical protein
MGQAVPHLRGVPLANGIRHTKTRYVIVNDWQDSKGFSKRLVPVEHLLELLRCKKIFLSILNRLTWIPVAARSKAWVCDRSLAGIAGSSPLERRVCLSVVSVVCCQVEVSATGWSLVQRSLTQCGVSKKCVITCKNDPRHLQWAGGRDQNKK